MIYGKRNLYSITYDSVVSPLFVSITKFQSSSGNNVLLEISNKWTFSFKFILLLAFVMFEQLEGMGKTVAIIWQTVLRARFSKKDKTIDTLTTLVSEIRKFIKNHSWCDVKYLYLYFCFLHLKWYSLYLRSRWQRLHVPFLIWWK